VLHLPLHFGYVVPVNEEAPESGGYRFTSGHPLHSPASWVLVEGGDLPLPVEIRVDRMPDGRHVVAGLRIEWPPDPRGITSQTLREIRLSEILAAYYDEFQPDYVFEIESSIAEVSYPARPPRGPGNQALMEFARTYMTELARQPRRAMTAAAKAHNISRATANRWAAICRELGLLPSASSGEDSSS
jgi:hypothetical protein